jgi:hypothetical protein
VFYTEQKTSSCVKKKLQMSAFIAPGGSSNLRIGQKVFLGHQKVSKSIPSFIFGKKTALSWEIVTWKIRRCH